MEQTTDQIEAHIKHTHEDLGDNLRALERKVIAVTDWKQRFQTNPMTMLGVAFGGGVALSAMLGGRRRGRREPNNSGAAIQTERPRSARQGAALETWDNFKGAMIGVAASRATDFIGTLIPGFQDRYRDIVEKKPRSV